MRDVLVGILGLEVQQLGDDEVGDLVVDGRAEEDDPLVEQAGVDVERALAAGGLLNDHGYKWAHGPRFSFALRAGFLPQDVLWPSRGASVGAHHRLALRCPQSVPRPLAGGRVLLGLGVGRPKLSRAWACSSGIGLASAAIISTALRAAMSSRTSSSRPDF